MHKECTDWDTYRKYGQSIFATMRWPMLIPEMWINWSKYGLWNGKAALNKRIDFFILYENRHIVIEIDDSSHLQHFIARCTGGVHARTPAP
jgi:hypothetical protein